MFKLFSTPIWFHGWDIVFDTIGVVVALLIAAYSWRFYHLNKENRYAYFSLAFIFIAVGFFFKDLTNATLYFTPVRDVAKDVLAPVAGQELSLSHLYYRAGFFLQMLFTLGAWLLIFFLSQKPRERLNKLYEVTQIALFVYFVGLISIVSNFQYTVFYLTSTVILSLIVLNYYKRYLTTKNRNTRSVMHSFLWILLGNIFFVFVFIHQALYVVGEIFMLIGFLYLLITYMSITKK